MWILEHSPANEEWKKEYSTEAEAVAELRKHICKDCMDGVHRTFDSSAPGGIRVEPSHFEKPDPNSRVSLLGTPCGCEYELYESDAEVAQW